MVTAPCCVACGLDALGEGFFALLMAEVICKGMKR